MLKQTSKAAVRTQSQKKLMTDRKKILDCLKQCPKTGCTRGEIAFKTGIKLQTVTWRIRDLIATNQVFVDGVKTFKKASSLSCEALFFNFDKEQQVA